MGSFVKTLVFSALTVGAMAAVAPHQAHAWLKFKNSTNTTVNVSHAYASVGTQYCGYWDSCDHSASRDYRVKGWWVLAPGAESTVSSKDYNNALHQYYAFGVNGVVWDGGGTSFKVNPAAAYNDCGGTTSADGSWRVFRKLNSNRCCGFSCVGFSEPNDKRIELVQ
jgi:hypothetical protein